MCNKYACIKTRNGFVGELCKFLCVIKFSSTDRLQKHYFSFRLNNNFMRISNLCVLYAYVPTWWEVILHTKHSIGGASSACCAGKLGGSDMSVERFSGKEMGGEVGKREKGKWEKGMEKKGGGEGWGKGGRRKEWEGRNWILIEGGKGIKKGFFASVKIKSWLRIRGVVFIPPPPKKKPK